MKVPFVVPHRSLPWPPGRVIRIMAVRRTRAKLLSRSGPDGRLTGCGAAVAQWEAAVRPRSVATPVDFNTRLGSKVAWYVVMAGGIVTSSPVPPSATLAPSPHPACACVWPYNSMAARGNSPIRGGGAANIRDSRVQGKPRAARSLTSILINPINLVRQGWYLRLGQP